MKPSRVKYITSTAFSVPRWVNIQGALPISIQPLKLRGLKGIEMEKAGSLRV